MAATINRDSGTRACTPKTPALQAIPRPFFFQQTSDYARYIVPFYFVLYIYNLGESPATSLRKTTKMKFKTTHRSHKLSNRPWAGGELHSFSSPVVVRIKIN